MKPIQIVSLIGAAIAMPAFIGGVANPTNFVCWGIAAMGILVAVGGIRQSQIQAGRPVEPQRSDRENHAHVAHKPKARKRRRRRKTVENGPSEYRLR